MKYRKLSAFLLAAILLLSLGACKPEEEPEIPEEPVDPNFPVTLELENDSIIIHEAPRSIVSLSPALTTLFYELGEEDKLDGVSSYAPELASDKADCGTAQHVDLEAVEDIAPQLLVTDTPLLSEQLTELYQMDVEVLEIPRPESTEELYQRAELILLALYGKEEGGEKADALRGKWEEAWQPLEDIGIAVIEDDMKSVLLLADLELAATGDSWEGQLLEDLSMKNLCAGGENWQLPQVQTAEDGTKTYLYGETVVDWNPAVIFYNSELDVEAIKAGERYAGSDAVANEALYPVDWNVLQLQSGELPEVLGGMAEQVYPDVWEMIQDAIAERKAAEEAAEAAAAEAASDAESTEEAKSEE